MGINMKNAEGYHDPTPHEALSNISREEKAAAKLPLSPLSIFALPLVAILKTTISEHEHFVVLL